MSLNSDNKLQVYFNEYNILMSNTVYLPLVSGLLQAYAETNEIIRDNYRFMPFIYARDYPDSIISRYDNPSVAAFSASMWNMNLCLCVARLVKEKFPSCLIVFGGPETPFEATEFFNDNPFVDVTVRGEGEQTFSEILVKYLETRDFVNVPGISYRDPVTGKCIHNNEERALVKDLDIYPSPYVEGVFDEIMKADMNFQAILETNRGCPFSCAYCFWGQGGLSTRYRFFSLERIKAIIDWFGRNNIVFTACADSNFGMFKRDIEIGKYFVETKVKYGFPEKVMATYGKNAEDSVYQLGKLLNEYNLTKGVTVSTQSNDPTTLHNVHRENIKLTTYKNLQRKFNEANIPVYTELILGLPGETYESFLNGIEETLAAGLKNQLFVYICQVFPNTALSDKDYMKKFEISTVRIPINEVHCSVHTKDDIIEYENIVFSTASMPVEDWRRAVVISWVMQLFHGLKLAFYILAYLVDRYHVKYTDLFEYVGLMRMKSDNIKVIKEEMLKFYDLVDSILEGNSRACVQPDFSSYYWTPEEASYLNISINKNAFFDEIYEVVKEYLIEKRLEFDEEELRQVIEYQRARVPNFLPPETEQYNFDYNIPEYFDTYFSGNRVALNKKPQSMNLREVKDFKGDKKTYATEIVVYGRKTDRMLYQLEWRDGR